MKLTCQISGQVYPSLLFWDAVLSWYTFMPHSLCLGGLRLSWAVWLPCLNVECWLKWLHPSMPGAGFNKWRLRALP